MFKEFKGSDDHLSSKVSSTSHIEIFPVLKAETLLRDEKRNDWVKELPEIIATSQAKYKLYYLPVLHHFAEFVQNLPETRNGFYSHHSGFLDHAIERTVRAMRLAQGYVTSDIEAGVSEELTGLWNYAIYTASLLFDVGKLATKLIVTLRQDTKRLRIWNPFEGSMLNFATHYSYEFAAENFDTLRRQVTPLLAKQLMPELGFGWLSSDKDILSAWFALLQEDYRQVSARMTVLPLADAEVLEAYFKNYEKHLAEKAKIDKLAIFKDPSLAIKATEVSKSAKYGLFTGATSTGTIPTGTFSTSDVAKMSTALGTVGGEAFLSWLRKNLASGKISVNLSNSGVHVTNEGVLLLSKIFEDFARDNPVYGNWREIKRQFERLEINQQFAATQTQAFRQYTTASEFKKLDEVTLVTNRYVVFLEAHKIPEVNPHVVAVNDKPQDLPPRPQNANEQIKPTSTR